MTDRFNGLFVVLEKDIRADDAQAVMAAISQLRGVLSVRGNVADFGAHIAQERARQEIGQKLLQALQPDPASR